MKTESIFSELNQLEDTLAYISPGGVCFSEQEKIKLRIKIIIIFKDLQKLRYVLVAKQINNFN